MARAWLTVMGLMSAAGVALSVAAAQPIVSEPRQAIDITLGNIEQLAADAGWASERFSDTNNEVLSITIGDRVIVVSPSACDAFGRQCGGLYAFALIPDQSNTQAANAFNVRYNSTRATIREGQVVLDRYIIADFGVTRGSLMVDLALHAEMINEWWAFRSETRPTLAVSFAPLLEEAPAPSATHLDEIVLSPDLLERLTGHHNRPPPDAR